MPTKGELQLLVGATGPSIKLFFDFLWRCPILFYPHTLFLSFSLWDIIISRQHACVMIAWGQSTFVPDFVQSGVPDILGDAEQEVRAHAGGISQEEFLATWANQTSESDKIWAGMLVSASSSLSSGISYASAQALFNATEPSSLLDPSWNATQLWRRAIQGIQETWRPPDSSCLFPQCYFFLSVSLFGLQVTLYRGPL